MGQPSPYMTLTIAASCGTKEYLHLQTALFWHYQYGAAYTPLVLYMYIHVPRFYILRAVVVSYMYIESHPRQLIFLRKSDCLGCAVLLCLVVCLTLLASFFLPSHLSLKHVQRVCNICVSSSEEGERVRVLPI